MVRRKAKIPKEVDDFVNDILRLPKIDDDVVRMFGKKRVR